MREPRLFDETAVGDDHVTLYRDMGDAGFERGSDTSEAAAVSVADVLSDLEQRVYDLLKAESRTCDAIEVVTGLSHQTVSARIRGLVLRDKVRDTGRRAPTRSGRSAAIWEVR